MECLNGKKKERKKKKKVKRTDIEKYLSFC